MSLIENYSLEMLWIIRQGYLDQEAKNTAHQQFIDQRILYYTKMIHDRENEMLLQMQTDFTNLLNELNNGSTVRITIN